MQDFLGPQAGRLDKHFYFNATKGFPCLKKAQGRGRPHCLEQGQGRPHPRVPEAVVSASSLLPALQPQVLPDDWPGLRLGLMGAWAHTLSADAQ